MLCANLTAVPIPPDASEQVQARVKAERARWLSQLDEITTWLADHWQHVALSYLSPLGIRELVARYAAAARGLWLSGRPLDQRLRMLAELTEPIQTIYFARRWRAAKDIPGETKRLRAMLDNLEKPAQPRIAPNTHTGAGTATPADHTSHPRNAQAATSPTAPPPIPNPPPMRGNQP